MKKGFLCLSFVLAACFVLQGFAEPSPEGNNVLIAYFTWGDNTVVEHPKQIDVDATTSASVLVPGNTAIMAGYIQELVGGDLFSIQVEEPYSSDYDECLERAADELDDDARPRLITHVENMEQYDIVFLGMPNWWYSCPRAILTFVESYDFSGKTLIPFVAHGTGGISGSVRDMSRSLPDSCTVLDPIGVYRPDIPSCGPRIEEWLNGLDLPFEVME